MKKLPKVGDIERFKSMYTNEVEYKLVTHVRTLDKVQSKLFPNQKVMPTQKYFKTLAEAKQFAKTLDR